MAFRALICEACGDSAHPDYVFRRMIGRIEPEGILIHDDCCAAIYDELCKLGEGDDPLTLRFKITPANWPSCKKEAA